MAFSDKLTLNATLQYEDLNGGMDALKGLTREVCLRDMMACPACQETVAAAMELGLEVFAEGLFLAEGLRIIAEARDSGRLPEIVAFSAEGARHPLAAGIIAATEAAVLPW